MAHDMAAEIEAFRRQIRLALGTPEPPPAVPPAAASKAEPAGPRHARSG